MCVLIGCGGGSLFPKWQSPRPPFMVSIVWAVKPPAGQRAKEPGHSSANGKGGICLRSEFFRVWGSGFADSQTFRRRKKAVLFVPPNGTHGQRGEPGRQSRGDRAYGPGGSRPAGCS